MAKQQKTTVLEAPPARSEQTAEDELRTCPSKRSSQ